MNARSTLMLALLISMFSLNTNAQKANKQSKKTNITIIREENGAKTIIDTTFTDADDAVIDEFFLKLGMDNSTPPVPPAPPALNAPPAPPAPPMPPAPPVPPINDDKSSYYFHFKTSENEADLETDVDQKMEEAKATLELARKEVRKSMEVNFNKEEYKRIMEDIEMQLKDIKIEIEKTDKKKRIIIHKKTSGVLDNDDEDMGNLFEPEMKQKVIIKTMSADINDEGHLMISENNNDEKNHCYYYTTGQPSIKERSKFRRFLNKVANKILE